MKIILFLITIFISTIPVKAQILEDYNTTGEMELVEYDLNRLTITDSLFLSELNSTAIQWFNNQCCDNRNKQYYYRMYFYLEDDSVIVAIEQSEYPGPKHKESIGYFEHKNHLFIISGNTGGLLFEQLPDMRKFSYKDYVQPTLMMLEDDIPSLIFQYKNKRFVPFYPKNILQQHKSKLQMPE